MDKPNLMMNLYQRPKANRRKKIKVELEIAFVVKISKANQKLNENCCETP